MNAPRLLFVLLISATALAQESSRPDLLLFNAHILTMNSAQPLAEAVAIQQERITWVGSDQDARKLFVPEVHSIDLHGARVLPGIIDAHTHLVELGKSLLRLNLKDAATPEAAIELVKKQVATATPGEWILGWGWDEGKWASAYPDNEALSKVSPNNPVLLTGLHSFAAWANKKALQVSGVTRQTRDPENGKIVRDEKTGEPTGILLNHAQELVERHIPPMSLENVKKAMELAARECVRNGLTSVHEARVSGVMVQALRELIQEGRMPLRVYVMLDGADPALVKQLAGARPGDRSPSSLDDPRVQTICRWRTGFARSGVAGAI